MDDEQQLTRATGPNHTGGDHTSPYPVSRMAPAIELVDLARQIERADHMLAVGVNGKLEIIAEQIRGLQKRAQEILDAAQRDAELHRARCNFVKRPGRVYHLYRSDTEAYFSMLSPDDWRGQSPHAFAGSYELLTDMTWQLRSEA
ncbi:MAG: DUF2452 domain-containing protein [Nannocystaceae bacterium]